MVLFLFFTSTIVFNLKPSSHHLPRLALLFAGGVILVYLMNEIKMLLLLFVVVVIRRENMQFRAKNRIIQEEVAGDIYSGSLLNIDTQIGCPFRAGINWIPQYQKYDVKLQTPLLTNKQSEKATLLQVLYIWRLSIESSLLR